jgi:hypothetical protein
MKVTATDVEQDLTLYCLSEATHVLWRQVCLVRHFSYLISDTLDWRILYQHAIALQV